ncbi:excisionase family DNA-binding protein (plasmid) [Coraliomargarita sp. W4R53]
MTITRSQAISDETRVLLGMQRDVYVPNLDHDEADHLLAVLAWGDERALAAADTPYVPRVHDDPISVLRGHSALTIRQAAVVLNMPESKIRELVRSGEIESVKWGRTVRVLSQPLARLLGDACANCEHAGGAER